MSVSPEEFASEQPPARPIGTECEYNLQLPIGKYLVGNFLNPEVLNRRGVINHDGYLGEDYGGGRVYDDVGQAEFCTKETLGPASAAVEDIGGIGRMAKIIQASGYAYDGLYRVAGMYMPKSPIAEHTPASLNGYSLGFHESYLFSRGIADDMLIDYLPATAMAARIWAGSGTIYGGNFVFSQKIWSCSEPAIEHMQMDRRTYHYRKPMALIPPVHYEKDTLSSLQWARFEVRSGDPGWSLVNRFLASAAISLSLRAVEQQERLGRERLFCVSFSRPVDAARLFARDLTLSQTSQTLDGRMMTAVDSQEALIDLYEELDEKVELPADEKVAIVALRGLIDALRTSHPNKLDYPSLLRVRTNFAPKHLFVSKAPGRLTTENDVAMQRNMEWDRVLPEGNAMAYWNVMADKDPLTQHVRSLAAQASDIRRADLRAKIIGRRNSLLEVVDWAHYKQKGDDTNRRMGDPINR
ncbi:MAG: proteasome accessory factor PafA [Candidatus Saccharibacteria bacterium]|nr:proteasome accessory factor PafA [Candidatus Saccharibacteria bacterium]